ncbi:MAG TPA: class I SAM-dependent methyltransferase [Kofleriaceae bacterium]|jgi:SAM-dependent methyltransferase|nr:class I SAM-dependent methyltransferase [Kofleriaceae bacterium]
MTEPHSKQFLTDDRDQWWSDEQLRSIAARLDLASVTAAADIGCGQGHWTRSVASLLPAPASLVGIDREQAWVDIARQRGGARYDVGSAEELPFADGSLDLVTAQTLLIHVADPARVLREMSRVLKPGGRLWLVEPNNLAATPTSFADPSIDPELLVAAFRLEAICERGKHALGGGYNSLGEQLVHLLEGWRDVSVSLCDRVVPFDEPAPDDIVTWPRAETLRYWLAGGGTEAAFEATWSAARTLVTKHRRGACGVLLYAYTARKA